jgi:sarcosine oxidase subunit gamma
MRRCGTAQLKLAERQAGLVAVAARRGQEARLDEMLRALLGIGLPQARHAVAAGDCAALWTGPAMTLLRAPPARLQGLRAAIPRGVAAVIDQSGGYAIMELSASKSAAVLAKACRIDLHPSAFAPGDCVRTLMAQTPTILHQLDASPSYELIVPRTLARSFAEFLIRAAQLCGVEMSASPDPEESREAP